MAFAGPVFSADENVSPGMGTAPQFEQMRADHLQRIEARIKSLQEEKACVHAAKNVDALRACRMKHRSEMKEFREEMRGKGGPGRPGFNIVPEQK